MTLIKTGFLNGIAVTIKLLTFLGINKLLSLYVGPIGYAFLGQYQNLITVVTTFASGAINTGVTKYTAEYYNHEEKQHRVWQTAIKIALFGSLVIAILLTWFRVKLAVFFLQDEQLSGVFVWFAATLTLFVFNALLLAILNGKKEIGLYIIANIIGSFLAFSCTVILVICFNLFGALVALATYQSIAFFATAWLCHKTAWFKWTYLWGALDPHMTKNLLRYAVMAALGAICVPGTQILVRNYIGMHINWDAAGYLEAMWRISAAYLMVVTTTLSVYFIPRLSELNDVNQIKNELVQTYKILVPFTVICSACIYMLRHWIIRWLFTEEFSGMSDLFFWQMSGDTVKVCSWILMYLYMAKNLFSLYVFSELFFSITFYLLVIFLVPYFELRAVAIAHVINYFLYFTFGFVSLKLKRVI